MQFQTATFKRGRVAILTLALFLAIGFGNAVAAPPEVGLTECDAAGCARGYAAQAPLVPYLESRRTYGDYISTSPMDIGFTE